MSAENPPPMPSLDTMASLTLALGIVIARTLELPHVREAIASIVLAPASGAEWLPLARAAEMIGVRARVLTDAARRGELRICGPRGARVVLRAELDAWITSSGIDPRAHAAPKTEREAARDDVAKLAARVRRRRARSAT